MPIPVFLQSPGIGRAVRVAAIAHRLRRFQRGNLHIWRAGCV